ncbi:MAG: DMT family transporter [Pseudomonadota bacterium]
MVRRIVARARPAGQTDNLRGMLAMMVAMICLIGSDSLVKLTSERLPLGEILFVRGLFMLALMVPIAFVIHAWRPLRVVRERYFILRILGELFAVFFYFLALFQMPLADVNALIQFAPLATMMAVAVFFGEPVGWRRWLAAVIGLVGVIAIIQPGGAGFTPYAFFVFGAVIGVTLRDIATREMDRDVPSFFIALTTGVAVTMLGLALAPFETWLVPNARDLLFLAISGFFLLGGYLLMIVAVRRGELSVVAPFRFTKVIWAILVGYLVWGHVPNALASVGFALVLGAGLYVFFRERALERRKRLRAGDATSSAQPAVAR